MVKRLLKQRFICTHIIPQFKISILIPAHVHKIFLIYVYVYDAFFFFFGMLLYGGRVFFLALLAAGQASRPWVHYDVYLDPGRAP